MKSTTEFDVEWDIYEAWLYQIEGIGRQKMRRFERGGVSFEELYRCSDESLHNMIRACYVKSGEGIRSLPEKTLERDYESILQARRNMEPEKLYVELINKDIHYVNYRSKEYPKNLLEIPDRPYALYRKGHAFDGNREHPILAIVGARMCSEYGKYVARQLGEMAAQVGFEVVSGLARGVDGIAQNAARLAGGEVTAVLGCGVDICYPKENWQIYERVLEKGRLISEYPPGTKPLGQNFPPRNRIIAGLSDALIVVEAKKQSGTLITVDMALEQGRDVYVIPGRVTDPMSYGCNRLIAQGAEGVVDLMETLLEIREKSLHKIHNITKSNNKTSNYEIGLHIGLHNIPCDDKINDGLNIQSALMQENHDDSSREIKPDDYNNRKLSLHNTKPNDYKSRRLSLHNKKTDDHKNQQLSLHNAEHKTEDVETEILKCIDVNPKSVQEIYESINQITELSLQKLQNKLIQMEMLGQIRDVGGRYDKGIL